MIQLPIEPSANERLLAGWTRERFTNETTDTVTLAHPPVAGLELVMLNGAVVDPDHATLNYTLSGTALTFGFTLVADDVVMVWYLARGN